MKKKKGTEAAQITKSLGWKDFSLGPTTSVRQPLLWHWAKEKRRGSLGWEESLRASPAVRQPPFFGGSEKDHPFQNHYTHEITIFELFKGLQLQLSGVF